MITRLSLLIYLQNQRFCLSFSWESSFSIVCRGCLHCDMFYFLQSFASSWGQIRVLLSLSTLIYVSLGLDLDAITASTFCFHSITRNRWQIWAVCLKVKEAINPMKHDEVDKLQQRGFVLVSEQNFYSLSRKLTDKAYQGDLKGSGKWNKR